MTSPNKGSLTNSLRSLDIGNSIVVPFAKAGVIRTLMHRVKAELGYKFTTKRIKEVIGGLELFKLRITRLS